MLMILPLLRFFQQMFRSEQNVLQKSQALNPLPSSWQSPSKARHDPHVTKRCRDACISCWHSKSSTSSILALMTLISPTEGGPTCRSGQPPDLGTPPAEGLIAAQPASSMPFLQELC